VSQDARRHQALVFACVAPASQGGPALMADIAATLINPPVARPHVGQI
jgi:hypothetical protein